ncbi:uncharacterized protein LOC125856007 [Solanum stenotomum]|uniref:uncharacterized protein LOC125856007 n=1 Tax=Solanum stenotomum TaxID=172797 RepID=UPI0020D19911|nr:uncharacterized protein LOC125856007 [Solanum stenotomum]
MTAQVSQEVVAPVDPIMSMATLKVRDFVRMNPPEFYSSKVGEVPQEFIYEVSKMLDFVRVTPVEKAELASYQLKGVAQVYDLQIEEGKIEETLRERKRLRIEDENSSRTRCDKRHSGKCLVDSNTYFSCGESGHKIRHCPMVAKNVRDSHRRSQPYLSSGPTGTTASAP